MNKKIINIGIFAHVDAGKTSITENLLFKSGTTKLLGNVDDGTTQTDFLKVEKDRGITVKSSYTSFVWENTQINIVDTPGHVDFTADLERSLRVIDAAILVISAVEGVQAHTETIWQGLRKRNIPIILFINKIDRIGADTQLVAEEIEKELTNSLAIIQKVENEGCSNVSVHSTWDSENINTNLIERIADFNDEILEQYLGEEKIEFNKIDAILKDAINSVEIYPLLFGSAKFSLGINDLLDAIIKYFPTIKNIQNDKLSALVFGLSHDKQMGKIAHVKVFSGQISKREVIFNYTKNIEEKVTQVRQTYANSFKDIGIVTSGNIAGICGLRNVQVGDVLGEMSENIPKDISLKTPLLTVQVKAEDDKDYVNLAYALQELSLEDPNLNFEWLKDEKELHLKIMGWIQMEIIESVLENRFSIKAKFENPTIIYKETPLKTGEGFVRYWMPKPCWSIMKFKIEPLKRGAGVVYHSEISVDDVHQKYQNEVERTIPEALKQGIKGWEVTDIKITLIEGEDHQVHSNPGDFVVATPMGIMDGLTNTGTSLLEPIVSFKIIAPDDLLGKITSDITKMRGTFNSPKIENDKFILTGTFPLASSLDYPVKLSSRSGGKAKISTNFHSYKKCKDEDGVIRDFKGISPLDTAKYILKARKALQ